MHPLPALVSHRTQPRARERAFCADQMNQKPSLVTPAVVAASLALAVTLTPTPSRASAGYATHARDYTAGTGAAPGYGFIPAIVGEPSRLVPGEFGGPVDPFSPPWQVEQILSLGAGGSVTATFLDGVFDAPSNPHGIDFIIFGSAGFLITNGDFTGGGITDGSLFGAATEGRTRVSVSYDGGTFYTLDPALAPTVDAYFPTDGNGDFFTPVDPSLKPTTFEGRDLAGIRALYAGSGGGAGYDIAWARTADGLPVSLPEIRHVRIEVLEGRAEIDAISVVPEPGPLSLIALGALSLTAARRLRLPTQRGL